MGTNLFSRFYFFITSVVRAGIKYFLSKDISQTSVLMLLLSVLVENVMPVLLSLRETYLRSFLVLF